MEHIINYKRQRRVNASLLKSLKNPINTYFIWTEQETENEDFAHLRVGSALDVVLTAPDNFNKEFAVGNVSRPYGIMGKFIDNLPPNLSDKSPLYYYEDAYEKSGYKMSLTTVVKLMWGNSMYKDYYYMKSQNPNIQILSKDEYELVMNLRTSILSNDKFKSYFIQEDNFFDFNSMLLLQFPLYFELEDVECKSLLDGIKIDFVNKKILPFDLKSTIKSVYDFHNEGFYVYGYYIQAALYMAGLKLWIEGKAYSDHPQIEKLNDKLKELNLSLSDFEIEDFEFVVASKKDNREPVISYSVSKESNYRFTFEDFKFQTEKYNCLKTLLESFKWHLNTDRWNVRRDVFENYFTVKI